MRRGITPLLLLLAAAIGLLGAATLAGPCLADTAAGAASPAAPAAVSPADAPTTVVGGVPAGWTNQPVTVTLTATDESSSVVSIEYQIEGASTWITYTAPFVVEREGVSTYACRATDAAGDVETPVVFTVAIDTSGPSTSCSSTRGFSGHPVSLHYEVRDALSPQATAVTLLVTNGRGKVVARLDRGTQATNAPLTASWTPPATGTYRVGVAANDLAGNPQTVATPGTLRVTGPWWTTIGHSVQGRPIRVTHFGSGSRRLLVIGGVHGNEYGTSVATQLAAYLAAYPEAVPTGARIDVIRCLNPDGYAHHTRGNARHVDLNRNLPTGNWRRVLGPRDDPGAPGLTGGSSPGSEPETKALLAYLRIGFHAVISLHSRAGILDCNGPGSATLGRRMSALCGLPVGQLSYDPYITGSLGSYVPEHYHEPVVTVELRSTRLTAGLRAALLTAAE